MRTIPLTICLFTSTKGHWGVKDRFQQTVTNLEKFFPLRDLNLLAHVKISPGSEQQGAEMHYWLETHGFKVISTTGEWDHGEQTHQSEYIRDMKRIYLGTEVNKYPYILHLEDDWLIQPSVNTLDYWFAKAMQIFELNPEINQIRIPRFNNEVSRICGLKKKHGIDAYASYGEDPEYFVHNDWSNNPFFARTRDMHALMMIMKRIYSSQHSHSEHSIGMAMKCLSQSTFPFVCFNPEMIRAYHIGCKPGEEDVIGKPLESN